MVQLFARTPTASSQGVKRAIYTESENRSNILMYDESSTELNVSMAHPWSKDILNRASKEAGYAAKKREMRKKSKYEALSVQDGTIPNLFPLVFEHFGF